MTTRIALLTLALVLLTGCDSGGAGLLVYAAFDGQPEAELVVVDSSGKEVRHITLPDAALANFPTQASHKAIFWTLDHRWYLVDAAQDAVAELAFPEEVRDNVYPITASIAPRNTGGQRWMLFGDAQLHQAYLLDLETGTLRDLTASVPGSVFLLRGATFAPNDDYLMLLVDSRLWLIPTADPDKARALGPNALTGGFSDDGRTIVYSRFPSKDKTEIVREQVDGSGAEVLVALDERAPVMWVPDGRHALNVRPDRLSLLSLDSRAERDVLTPSGVVREMRLTPDRRKLVIQVEDQTAQWYVVDLAAGAAQALDALKGYTFDFSASSDDPRWLILADILPSASIEDGHLAILNLESLEVRQLPIPAQGRLFPFFTSSSDGRFSLVSVVTENNTMQLWLLRAEQGDARLLAEEVSVGGALSPDGRWVAVSQIERQGATRKATLTLVATDGDDPRPIGSGVSPVWVLP